MAERATRRIQWKPNTTDWYGRFHITQGPENEYMLDRELQKSGKSYSGIPGGARPQDMAVTYSMGSIYDRSREHLGTTDQLIIRTSAPRARRRARPARQRHLPPGVDDPEIYRQRSGGVDAASQRRLVGRHAGTAPGLRQARGTLSRWSAYRPQTLRHLGCHVACGR